MNEETYEAYAVPNVPGPGRPVTFDPEICNGCNRCVDVCTMDILAPNPEKGKPPLILYPEECEFDGSCWSHCPRQDRGAIDIMVPLPMRASILKGEPK